MKVASWFFDRIANACGRNLLFLIIIAIGFPAASPLFAQEVPEDANKPQNTVCLPAAVGEDVADLSWLDSFYLYACSNLQGYVTRADSFFAATEEDKLLINNSTFKLETVFEVKNEDRMQYAVYPRFDAHLNIPNLTKRYKIFINTVAPDELPGIKAADQERSLFLGLSHDLYEAMRTKLNARVGIKWRWPPILFSKLEYIYLFKGQHWKFLPRQSLYWYSDDGFGETTSLQMDYWLGPRWLTRSDSAAKVTQGTRGMEWEQSFSMGYIVKGDGDSLEYASGTQASAFGHYENSHGQVDTYRLSLRHWRPVLRKWMFIKFELEADYILDAEELAPDEDYKIVPSFSIGIDMLFYGVEQDL